MLGRKTVLVLVAQIALLSAGCQAESRPPRDAGSTRHVAPASPSPSQRALPIVARRLGPPPGNCPGPYPRPQNVAAAYGPLIGGRPLWAGMYAGYDPKRHAYRADDAPRTRYGFRVKVLWIMAPDPDATVTISARNLERNTPLWIDVEDAGDAGMGTRVVLDPRFGGTGEGGWREFPSYVFFDRAGCFELRASSAEGSWRIRFGFGR
jgi:hypothetical protein